MSFILELWCQHCTVMVNIKNKIRTSAKPLVSKKARTWRLKRTSGLTINIYEKQCLSVITQNEKHLSKQIVPITNKHTLQKRILAAAILLKVCESFESISVCMSLLLISREEKIKSIQFMKIIVSLMHQSVNLS